MSSEVRKMGVETVVTGVGVWVKGVTGGTAWLAGTHDPELVRPAAEVLGPRGRRRASAITRARAPAGSLCRGVACASDVSIA